MANQRIERLSGIAMVHTIVTSLYGVHLYSVFDETEAMAPRFA
jgi:hypothetical protein